MSRVIQDSDDELEDDLEVEVQRIEANDASPKQSASDTSSTEALRRQIEAAHRAHLQSQLSVNDYQMPTALDVNQEKRKAPTKFDLHSRRNAATQEIPMTYAKRANGANGNLPEGLQQDQILQLADQHHGTNWVLEGTMREAYAQHNPNALFPEPSSTVPNATLTQQRVLEGVNAPALFGSDADAGRTAFRPDASIPWSEYLKSPMNTGEQQKSSAQHSHGSQRTSLPDLGPSLNEDLASFISQSNRIDPRRLTGSSPQDKSTGLVESLPDRTPSSSRNMRKTKRIPSLTLSSDDDLAESGLPKEQYRPRPSRSRSLKAGTQEPIDYSVKPEKAAKASKRRKSTPANTTIANSLSTPERVQQICEMGFTPSTSAQALKQNDGDVTQSVDWLITNRVADDELVSHASQISRGNNDQLIACVDTSEHNDDDQAMPMDLGTVSDTFFNTTIIAPVEDLKSPTKVQVVIPVKAPDFAADKFATPERSRRKPKRRKTTLDEPEPDVATDDTVFKATIEKKRCRGRPKNASKTASSAEIVHEDEMNGPREQVRDSALLSMDGNVRLALAQQQFEASGTSLSARPTPRSDNSHFEDRNSAVAIPKSTPELRELPGRPEVEPITPERVKKPARREPSSSNKSKVPHRVGLSKRTRIAPLLRVIKK